MEVPGRAVAIGRPSQRHDARFARAQMLHNPFDHAIFASGVATFDQNQNLVIALNEVLLQLDQFYL